MMILLTKPTIALNIQNYNCFSIRGEINLGFTRIVKPISLTYNERYMFKIATMPSARQDASYIARAALGALRIITDETVVVDLSHNLPKSFIKKSLFYLADKADGTNLQLKGNFLSSIIKNNSLDVKDVLEAHQMTSNNTKLTIVSNGKMSIRSLMEISVADNFIQTHPESFKRGVITGDNLITNNNTQSNEDFYQELISSFGIKGVSIDIKLGNNMAKRAMSGTLGQIHYDGDIQISTPNDYIDLVAFNIKRKREIACLLDDLDSKRISLSQEQVNMLHSNIKILRPLFNTLEVNGIVEKHIEIERILIKIHSLPELPRRPGFINIVTLNPSRPLMSSEEHFIKELLPYIDESIFKSQKSFNKFIRKAVSLYQKTVDQQAVQKIHVVQNTTWEYSFLDKIDIDLFNV